MSEPAFKPWHFAGQGVLVCDDDTAEYPLGLVDNEEPAGKLIEAAPDIYEQLAKADVLLRLVEDYFLESKRRPRPAWFGAVQTTIAGTSAALAKADGR